MMQPYSDYQQKSYETFWDGEHMRILKDQESDMVLDMLRPSDGWFMDAGCGYGRFYSLYEDLFSHRIMLDYSIENLQRFRDKHQSVGTYFIAGDVCMLPFRDTTFDTILGIRLIQNNADAKGLVASLSRVLKPNGQLFMSYFNRRNLLRIPKHGTRCFHRVHQCEHKASFGEMYATHPELFRMIAEDNHLKQRRIRGAGFTYQISNNSKPIQKLVEQSPLFSRLFGKTGRMVDSVLGPIRYSLWEFCDLEKDPAGHDIQVEHSIDLADMLQCPACNETDFEVSDDAFTCYVCKRSFPITDGIYDFRLSE